MVLSAHEQQSHWCWAVSQADVQHKTGETANRSRVQHALKKLHINLGHASQADMVRILKHHGAQDCVLEQVRAFQCDLCDARRAPKAVKQSSVPRDLAPLRYVGLDVKWLPPWKRDHPIKALNIVCRASGLQHMYPFRETENSDLICRLYRQWTRCYGRPRYIKFDAGRCNLGQPFVDLLERDGATALDIPGEAHEQMGDVEVQGRHFEDMLKRVIDQMSPEDYGQWLECVDVTTEAKNSLMRKGGYSAYQMVFGRDPEIPGDDLLGEDPNPIANGAILEDSIADFSHRARLVARQAVLEALDHRAARIALNTRPRPFREFRPGDEVAVWRRGRGIKKSSARWRGPGIVAGATGGNLWVSMPGAFIKCSPEQLRLRTTEEREADRFLVRDLRAAAAQLYPEVGVSNKTQKQFMDITQDDLPPGDLLTPEPATIPDCRPRAEENSADEPSAENASQRSPETIPSQTSIFPETISSYQDSVNRLSDRERAVLDESVRKADRLDGHQRPAEAQPDPKRQRQTIAGQEYPPSLPAPPSVGQPNVNDGSTSSSATSSSSCSSFVNITGPRDSTCQAVCFSDRAETEENFVFACTESECLLAGGRKEIDLKESKWQTPEGQTKLFKGIRKETKNVVEDKGALRPLSVEESRQVKRDHSDRIVPSRLVLITKLEDSGEEVVKARWTARGDKDPDLFDLIREGRTQSPTISSNGRFVVLQTIASKGFVMQLGDVTGAFLEADAIGRQKGRLFMAQPKNGPFPDYDPEQVFEIVKPMYGLNDSPQMWFSKFRDTVEALNWTQSKLDPCVYFLWDHAGAQPDLAGVLGVHVDDVVIGGRGKYFEEVLGQLRNTFPFRKWKIGEGTFCGSFLSQAQDGTITVGQQEFVDKLARPKLRNRANPDFEVTSQEASSLKSTLGGALWLAKETRPDLAVQVSQGQQLLPNPTLGQARTIGNVVRRAKQFRSSTWKILPIPFDQLRMCVHSDAAFGNAKKCGTQAGYIIGMTDPNLESGQTAKWSPATWKSYRLKRVVGSTFAGEIQVLSDALGHAEWIGCMIMEAKHCSFSLKERASFLRELNIQAITDCKSIFDHLQTFASPSSVSDKRVAIDLVIIRDLLSKIQGRIRWVPTWLQLADALTKENADAMDNLRGAMLNNTYQMSSESANMQLAAEQKRFRKEKSDVGTTGSNVLFVHFSDQTGSRQMVKVSTSGLTEKEVRSLMEIMASQASENADDFLKNVSQSRAACKIRIPLRFIDSHRFRGEGATTTMSYAKSTSMVTIHAGAAFVDHVEDIVKAMFQKYAEYLRDNEVSPLPKGCEHWGEAFRQIGKHGARSFYLENEVKQEPNDQEKVKTEIPEIFVPDEPEYHAAIAELSHEASRKLHKFPGWKQKFLQVMLKDFGADPNMVMELSGLADQYAIHSDGDEWAEIKEEPMKTAKSKAKPQLFGYRG